MENSTTGGGLMPWIVLIPLGVMLLGMAAMFLWLSTRPQRPSATVGARMMGIWLIFISVLEGAIGAGMAVAEARADGSNGGFALAAYVLLGTSGILLIFGIRMTRRALKS